MRIRRGFVSIPIYSCILVFAGCSNTSFSPPITDSLFDKAKSLDQSDFRAIGGCENVDQWLDTGHPMQIGSQFVESGAQFSEDFSLKVVGVVTKIDDADFRADWFAVSRDCEIALLETDLEFEPDFDYTWFGI